MLLYLTKTEVEQLKAGKSLDIPDIRFDWFKVYEPDPRKELTPDDIAQAKIELNCSDEELAGMEA